MSDQDESPHLQGRKARDAILNSISNLDEKRRAAQAELAQVLAQRQFEKEYCAVAPASRPATHSCSQKCHLAKAGEAWVTLFGRCNHSSRRR